MKQFEYFRNGSNCKGICRFEQIKSTFLKLTEKEPEKTSNNSFRSSKSSCNLLLPV